MPRYKQQYDGDWIFPRRRNYLMQCCGCNMTHRINFALVKHGRGFRIAFQAFRIKRRKKLQPPLDDILENL